MALVPQNVDRFDDDVKKPPKHDCIRLAMRAREQVQDAAAFPELLKLLESPPRSLVGDISANAPDCLFVKWRRLNLRNGDPRMK